MIQNNNKNKKLCGFSLAETLITLLIVTILVLASVPVITKKKMIPSEPHGKWMCTLNAQGQYVTWETGDENMNNADSWKTTGKNYCEFKIPKNARNFAVTAAGGGGGGAGAEKTYFLKTGSQTIPFDEKMAGTYKMIAIASGGSGGYSNCDLHAALGGSNLSEEGDNLFGAAGGGGAGGAGYAEYIVDKNTTAIELVTGAAVSTPGTTDYTAIGWGQEGNPSYIRRFYPNSNGIDISEDIIYAKGGGGGGTMWHICDNNKNNAYGGAVGVVSFNGSGEYIDKRSTNSDSKNRITADKGNEKCSSYSGIGCGVYSFNKNCDCGGDISTYSLDTINRLLGSKLIATKKTEDVPGKGGSTGSSREKKCKDWRAYCAGNSTTQSDIYRITRSNAGYVAIVSNKVIPGGGGGAAVGISNSLKTDFGNVLSLKVTIGKGGAGGKAGEYDTGNQKLISHATNGSAGTKTVIGNNIFVLNGGSGGKAGKTYNQTAGWTSIAGKDGEQAPINNSKVLVQTGLDQEKKALYQKGWGGMAHLDQYAEGAEVGPDGNTSVFYGAGGGGGGVGEDGSLGNGGAGSPGFVMIEW